MSERDRFAGLFLIALAVMITLLFFGMIRGFLQALLLSAVFSGMLSPTFRKLATRLGGRRRTAAVIVIVMFVVILVVPLSIFLGMVVSQAVDVSSSVGPWIEAQIAEPDNIDGLLRRLPFWEAIQPYENQITSKVAELAGRLGTFLVSTLAAASRGTAGFFFDLFVMLYAMFFFLLYGKKYLLTTLYYMPLKPNAEARLIERFVSVTRATIKGTLIIGVLQGGLAGAAFFVLGVRGWAFWTVIMMVLSIVPGVGTALVWVPTVIYLLALGKTGAAIALAIWCAGVVGLVDNFLRPRLVGRDTQMSDLLVLLGTLGGIVFFGAAGVIIGPLVAALWVTVWEIYGEVFADYLPPARLSGRTEVEVPAAVSDAPQGEAPEAKGQVDDGIDDAGKG